MAKPSPRLHVVLTPTARNDIREALICSEERFGKPAATRYRSLISQALRDLSTDPARPGSLDRNELARGVRTYHLSCGRHPVQAKCWLPGRQECCQQGHTATIGRLLVMLSLRTPTQN